MSQRYSTDKNNQTHYKPYTLRRIEAEKEWLLCMRAGREDCTTPSQLMKRGQEAKPDVLKQLEQKEYKRNWMRIKRAEEKGKIKPRKRRVYNRTKLYVPILIRKGIHYCNICEIRTDSMFVDYGTEDRCGDCVSRYGKI